MIISSMIIYDKDSTSEFNDNKENNNEDNDKEDKKRKTTRTKRKIYLRKAPSNKTR